MHTRTHTHTHTHLHTFTLHICKLKTGNGPSLMALCSGGGETSLPLCGMAVYEFVVKMAESSSMHRVDKMADWRISYVKIHKLHVRSRPPVTPCQSSVSSPSRDLAVRSAVSIPVTGLRLLAGKPRPSPRQP